MISAATLAPLRTAEAIARELASIDETYGSYCYMCGEPNPTRSIVVRHSIDPLITTDEFICA